MARRRAVGGRARGLPLTDTARAYVATGATAVLGGALFAAAGFTSFAGGPYLTAEDRLSVQALTGLAYLFLWPVYCFAYALLVWRAYRRLDPVTLRVTARRDLREGRRLVNRVFGEGGAVSSATTVSAAAVIVTVLVAQSGLLDRSPALIVLAFLTVAGSWVVMLVTFSLAYLRLNEASRATGGRHLELASPHPYRFDDYVTVALLASTMAATISVAPRTREGWRLLRANVAVAFAFNSVVIAMVVSLLIGGLGV